MPKPPKGKAPKEPKSDTQREGEASELATRLLRRWGQLNGKLTYWSTFFDELAQFIQPRKYNQIVSKIDTPSVNPNANLYDSTAVQANLTFGRGMMSSNTPAGAPWFSFTAPAWLEDDDEVKQWFATCTEVAQAEIAKSNFYDRELEDLLDYGGYGTAALYCEEGEKNLLNFQNFFIGSYAIAENDEGQVDTVYRRYTMTPRQMEQKFGRENLPKELRKLFEKGGEELDAKGDLDREILHCIEPRENYDPTKGDGENRPIASIYIDITFKHVLRNSGYAEMPVFVSRFLKWGNENYGWSPSWAALPEARQANFLEKHQDALAEIKAWPRMLIPDTHEGQIDLRASGVTYWSGQNKPEVWGTEGDYNPGLERIQAKQQAIKDAFFVDLFQMFSNREKPITAYEASLLNGEKLTLLAATTSARNSEHYNPLMRRIWGILIRAGAFPPPPEQLIQYNLDGTATLPDPSISYNSKIALAIKAVETNAWLDFLSTQAPLFELRPDILDNFDLDEIERDIARNGGMPPRWLVDVEQRDQMRQARAEQQEQERALAAQEMASKTIKNSADAQMAQAA